MSSAANVQTPDERTPDRVGCGPYQLLPRGGRQQVGEIAGMSALMLNA